MPKPKLTPKYDELEKQIIATFIAGHKRWRPDLSFPESYSDMQGGARALLEMFDIKRRPLPLAPGDIVHPSEACQGPCCRRSEAGGDTR